MEIKNNTHSILKLKSIIVKDFSFDRQLIFDSNVLPKITLTKKIETNDDIDSYVTLTIKLIADAAYSLSLSIVGIFSVSDEDAKKINISKEVLLEKNAISILFPYLRSQITLLTSQPSFQPIVLPPININALFDDNHN